MEVLRKEAERVIRTTKKGIPFIIGGDFNAQIGRNGIENNDVVGKFGYNYTNGQGEELVQWLRENDLSWVNSFHFIKKRGTWYNRSVKKWYELDGFVTHLQDRKYLVQKVKVIRAPESDHNAVCMTLQKKVARKLMRMNKKEHKAKTKSRKNINWQKLWIQENENRYRDLTKALIEGDNQELSWEKEQQIMLTSAEQVCGKNSSNINPWMNAHEKEIKEMKDKIAQVLSRRNLVRRDNTEEGRKELQRIKKEISNERRKYKDCSKKWEEDWWNELADRCEQAWKLGRLGEMYDLLKKLQKSGEYNNSKNILLFSEEIFKEHLEKITENRYESDVIKIETVMNKVEAPDIDEVKIKELQAGLEILPTSEEIMKEMAKMKDSAPGEDGIRLGFIKKASKEIQDVVIQKVKDMWNTSATLREEPLKVGVIIPLFKKGDKSDPNNYRGICLLPILSRILGRILATRIRKWAEEMKLLDENQAGFRTGRSTADATQIFICFQEDSIMLKNALDGQSQPILSREQLQAFLLDLKKAYPRVSKPILWKILEKLKMPRSTISKLQDLYEFTEYKVRGHERDSSSFFPQRGLREGCPTSPVIFNIYHQAVMRVATEVRKEKANDIGWDVGIKWSYMPGNSLPPVHKKYTFNSEAKRTDFDLSLFADDTTIIGNGQEIDMGKELIEEVMGNFEEQTNKSKEEHVIFGDPESGNTRMLGTWLGREKDTKMRLQRAGKVWSTIRKRFIKCKLSKTTQAKVFEACVESTMLFNVAVRPFSAREIKSLQRFCDKKYRYIWSDRKSEPLRQMQEYGINMADIRNQLQVSSVRTKVDVAHLIRLGHILRLPDESLVKQALLGWLTTLEDKVKAKKKTLMIIPYWRRLIKEAGMEANMIEELTSNRLDWKERVKKRQLHMQEYERQQRKTYIIPEGTDKIYQEAKESDVKMQSVCIKIAIEYLEQELHSQSTKNDCTEIVPMHLYLYVRNLEMNLSRRAV